MDKNAFELQYKDVATRVGTELGVPPGALIAQWGLETGWGKSVIPGTNNLGNIKDFSGKGVTATDNLTGSKDKYRAYATVDEFATDFTSLIKRKYPAAMNQSTAAGFATALKAGGYAEDKDYVAKLTWLAGEQVPAAPASPTRTWSALKGEDKGLQGRLAEASGVYRAQEEAEPSALEMLGAAMAGSTDAKLFRPIADALFGEEFAPVAGFKPDLAALPQNWDPELKEDYLGATSPQAADKVLNTFNDEQIRLRAIGSQGAATAIGVSLLAEGLSVTNWATAWAAPAVLAARGVGSAALAERGASRAAVIGSSIAENVLSGTAIEATVQLLDGRFKGTDLAISLVADSLIGAAAGALTKSAAQGAQFATVERMMQRLADSAIEQEGAAVARAQAKLGNMATPEQVVAEVQAERLANTLGPMRQAAVADNGLSTQPLAQLDEVSQFADPANEVRVGRDMTSDVRFTEMADLGVFKHTDDFNERKAQVDALDTTPGIHLSPSIAANGVYKRHAEALESLRAQLIPEVSLHYTDGGVGLGTNTGVAGILKPGVSMIAVKPGGGMRAAVHEFAHIVFAHRLAKATPEQKAAMIADWQQWRDDLLRAPGRAQEAMLKRSPVAATGDAAGTAVYTEALSGNWKRSLSDVFGLVFNDRAEQSKFVGYFSNFNEYSAEQLLKYMEAGSLDNVKTELSVPAAIVRMFQALLQSALDVFKVAKAKGILAPSTAFSSFFDDLVVGNRKSGLSPLSPNLDTDIQAMAVPAKPAAVASSILTDPDANRFGLGTVPVGTKAERDDAKAILALHRTAEKDAPVMTLKYLENVKNLADNSVFNVASTGLTMLKSQSPLVRWVASQLLEDASGVQAKRGTTAAIKKHLMERLMMGNTINDIDSAYSIWKNGKVGGWQDDLIGGKNRAEFDRLMAEEIEARRVAKAPVSTDGNVKSAVDSIEAAYTRTAKAQIDAKTLGSEGLPTSSVGYMPHRMSAKAVFNLTNEKREVVHQALTDQFINIEGWDASFSDMLASKYMQRVLDRATGGNSSTLGGNSSSSVALVEEALNNMQLPADQVAKHMASFKKGAANFTKGRIELDLNKVYPTTQGDFKLLDIFETNQIELLRSQVQRASGDVALALKGVQGKPGLTLLRKAMQFGEDGKKASPADLEAFDQIAAELMGEPFGTATPRWMERAMSANTLVRLGGIVYNQISESINGIVHVGAMRVLESVTGIPRLRQEILALARGEKVDNSIIGSIELAGGAEFGTDAYKIVMPFDNPSNTMPTYGQDTLTLTDRLLRGGGHIQAKLSGWRAIHSAQQRGMAEQIVHKTLRYIREGKDDIALQQFGITPELQQAMRAELGTIARFDGDRLVEFDVTQMTDPAMREQLIQAVWRGTSQIIQGTYIGERGKWAHDGTLKLLTQFRTFSITSMEKQWGRQRNSRGAFATFGIIMGAMSLAAPIYMARTYASSIGRPDQAEYLEERFQPQHLARATMNYVANLGLAPDMIDGLSAMLPESMGVKATGGRAGVETDFVGNYVAPAFSLVDDVWKYAQSPLEMDDAARILPLRNLPYLVPLMNLTKE